MVEKIWNNPRDISRGIIEVRVRERLLQGQNLYLLKDIDSRY